MSVYKDKKPGTWKVCYRYTDWQGEVHQSTKRGFSTKKEAQQWERDFCNKNEGNLNMTFADFVEIYLVEREPRLKENTFYTKEQIIRTKILPFFGNKKISEIKPKDVIAWQNELIKSVTKKGEPYSVVYLKTIHNQLSAIFNHAVKYYNLKENPAAIAGSMGKSKGKEMLIWTPEEYKDFSFAIMDNPVSFYAFEMLYWTGIRLGELLALTPEAFDFEKGTVTIDKSYQRLKRRDVVTTPKSDGSIRVIVMPDFLRDEMKEYIEKLYKIGKDERLFLVSKSQMHREMSRGCEEAGLKRIRIHDLRHSHVSLLIHLGYSAVAIGKRMGHESEKITYMYAHLFPSEQKDMGNKLNKLREETA